MFTILIGICTILVNWLPVSGLHKLSAEVFLLILAYIVGKLSK